MNTQSTELAARIS